MSEFDLSIIIVSYNVCKLLEQCLRSIVGESTSFVQEIIVIENASRDGSAEMVRSQFPMVQVIENRENRGFAAANNQGFAPSRGRYVMMLNPDTVVRRGALPALAHFMDQHPRAGACGGKLVFPDGALQHSAFQFPTVAQVWLDFFPTNWRLMESRINGRYPRAWYARGEPFQIDHPLGADFFVRRTAADQVGWLDEQFFLNGEEIDWAIRLKRAGWEIWCVPSAVIVHYEAQSKQQFRDESFANLWRARFRLFEKHYSPTFQWVVKQIVRVGLGRLTRQARAQSQRGQVTQDELASRLGAYQQIRQITDR